MTRVLAGLSAGILICSSLTPALASGVRPGALVEENDSCVIEVKSSTDESIQLQNICRNPVAVRISWSDGRLFDYCLNSSGDMRSVAKRTENYRFTREQAILLCR